MNILLYDTDKFDIDTCNQVFNLLKETLDADLIALPKDFTLLLDCSTAMLYDIRNKIDEAIHDKELIEEV